MSFLTCYALLSLDCLDLLGYIAVKAASRYSVLNFRIKSYYVM